MQTKKCSPSQVALVVFLTAAPPILFYSVLLANAVNIPFQDDYEAVLNFVNNMSVRDHGRLGYLFASRFNGYRLVFERLVIWIQFSLFHVIDFRVLCAIGDAFVLPLALLLWKMFLPSEKDVVTRLVFFLPVPWLLFQLQYIETLNWAMASLANLTVVFFSLAAIYLLTLDTRFALAGAAICLMASIGSMINGLLLSSLWRDEARI